MLVFFFTSHSTGRFLTWVLTKLRSGLPPNLGQESAVAAIAPLPFSFSASSRDDSARTTTAPSVAQVTRPANQRPRTGYDRIAVSPSSKPAGESPSLRGTLTPQARGLA